VHIIVVRFKITFLKHSTSKCCGAYWFSIREYNDYCCIIQFLGGSRREIDHWGDPGIDGWIILRWISRRWDVGIWTGLG